MVSASNHSVFLLKYNQDEKAKKKKTVQLIDVGSPLKSRDLRTNRSENAHTINTPKHITLYPHSLSY